MNPAGQRLISNLEVWLSPPAVWYLQGIHLCDIPSYTKMVHTDVCTVNATITAIVLTNQTICNLPSTCSTLS